LNLESKKDIRGFLTEAEKQLAELPQVEMTPVHHHAKDLYARELFIPEDTLLIGKIHKHQSFNVLAQGEMSILTENGVKRIKAPYTVVSNPGIKRMGYAHTDCVWIAVHGTEETDLELIEKDVIAETYEDVECIENETNKFIEMIEKENLCLG
jgi:hypothetical protein